MAAAPARGVDRQTAIIQPAAPSCVPLSPQDDPASLSHPTPSSAQTTASHTPSTPQRGRSTTRYPDSLGRVPLHRRGTSKTYERLEDLLREAGYKETRVFTPEADRNMWSTTRKRDGGAENSVRGSIGAVVDFITGLVSRGSSMSGESALQEDNSRQSASHWSSPSSPLARTVRIEDNRSTLVSSMTSPSRNGPSENTRRRARVDLSKHASHRTHVYQVSEAHQSSQELPHPRSYIKAHHINHSQLSNDSSKSSPSMPNPPNARAYLRHMMSAPSMQPLTKRPSLSEASLRSALGRDRRNGTRRTFIFNDEDSIAESDYEPRSRVTLGDHEHQIHPPLPRNWIESVARTLLSGVGAPAAVTSDAASMRTAKTASTRKSSALSDKSNQERGRARTKPPLLCVQMRDVKASTSKGQVSCTRVMCRSTPSSRASSRTGHGDRTRARNSGKKREEDRPRSRRRVKNQDTNVVPSLARTKAENDDWMAPRQRYSSGWGVAGGAQAHLRGTWSDESDDDDDDDDDDEGELGLDRLLVPARRQHSIQSLRKHLQRSPSQSFSGRGAPRPGTPRSGRASPFGGTQTGRLDWGNASWSTSRGREWLTSEGEEGEDAHRHAFSGSEVAAGTSNPRWKQALPGLVQWTTSS